MSQRRINQGKYARLGMLAVAFITVAAGLQFNSLTAQDATQPVIGMGGYCPVCILEMKAWEEGKQEFQVTYDNVTYLFPNEEIKQKFAMNPGKYVPGLGGDCIVCYAMAQMRRPGSVDHASLYKERIYLFPGAKEKAMFEENPDKYVDADLAMDGNCSVCKAKMGKDVPGKTEFTEFHNGLRYLFSSAKEQAMFRAAPGDFVAMTGVATTGVSVTGRAMQPKTAAKTTAQFVSYSGRAGCSGCEHGVKPLQNPEELGYAVNTTDGRVIVVEHAHDRYPQLYAGRFDGMQVQVIGEVIKQEGKYTWVLPTALTQVN